VQITSIADKLDDLVDATRRIGKKAWRMMLYGAAFGMIVNDMVPPHVLQGIITSVITGLGHIFGLDANAAITVHYGVTARETSIPRMAI